MFLEFALCNTVYFFLILFEILHYFTPYFTSRNSGLDNFA